MGNILEGPFIVESYGEGIVVIVFFDLGFMKMLSMLLACCSPIAYLLSSLQLSLVPCSACDISVTTKGVTLTQGLACTWQHMAC